jgi:hypothetical protein
VTTTVNPARPVPDRAADAAPRAPFLLRATWQASLLLLIAPAVYLLGAHFRTAQAAWTTIPDQLARPAALVGVAALTITYITHTAWRWAARRP